MELFHDGHELLWVHDIDDDQRITRLVSFWPSANCSENKKEKDEAGQENKSSIVGAN
jgi:hypothetical protein